MKIIVCLVFLIGAATAGHYGHGHEYTSSSTSFDLPMKKKDYVKIIRLQGSTDNAGNYNFDSESADGTKLSEIGGLKVIKGETGATKEGSASWTSPEGKQFMLKYTADERGFIPVGDHLPVSPPIPIEIQRVLPLLPKLDLSMYEPDAKYEGKYDGKYEGKYDGKYEGKYEKPMFRPLVLAIVPPAKPFVSMGTAPILSPSSSMNFPPAPPSFDKPLEAPTKTFVVTPDFVIDSQPTRTFFRIGH